MDNSRDVSNFEYCGVWVDVSYWFDLSVEVLEWGVYLWLKNFEGVCLDRGGLNSKNWKSLYCSLMGIYLF